MTPYQLHVLRVGVNSTLLTPKCQGAELFFVYRGLWLFPVLSERSAIPVGYLPVFSFQNTLSHPSLSPNVLTSAEVDWIEINDINLHLGEVSDFPSLDIRRLPEACGQISYFKSSAESALGKSQDLGVGRSFWKS